MAKYVVFFAFFLCSKSCDAPECESGMKPCFCPFCLSFSGSHSIFMVIVVILFLVHFLICSQGEVQSSFLCNVCVLSQFQIGSPTCLLCLHCQNQILSPNSRSETEVFQFHKCTNLILSGKEKNEKLSQQMWFGCHERYAMVFRYLTLCLLKKVF